MYNNNFSPSAVHDTMSFFHITKGVYGCFNMLQPRSWMAKRCPQLQSQQLPFEKGTAKCCGLRECTRHSMDTFWHADLSPSPLGNATSVFALPLACAQYCSSAIMEVGWDGPWLCRGMAIHTMVSCLECMALWHERRMGKSQYV